MSNNSFSYWYEYLTGYISYEEYQNENNIFGLASSVQFYSTACCTPISIIGNLIVFLVYFSKEFRKMSISFYYCANAVIDTLFVSFIFFQSILISYYKNIMTSFLCKLFSIIGLALPTISAFISIMAALDRLRFNACRSKLKFMEKSLFQWIYLISVIIIVTGVLIPNGLHRYFSNGYCYSESFEMYIAYTWVFLVLSAFFPSFIIAISSIMLIISIKRLKRKLNSNRNYNSKKTKTKLVSNILWINLLFAVTNISDGVVWIFYATSYYYQSFFWHNYGKIQLALCILNAVQYLNSTAPILVHLLTNKLFYNIVKDFIKKTIKS